MGQLGTRQSLSRFGGQSEFRSAFFERVLGPSLGLLQIEPIRREAPLQPLVHLDALWLQVAGTLCNLSCTHCFVSCGPGNLHHGLMSRAEVHAHLDDGLALGVREVYLTGGEPFLHPELLGILEDVLSEAPCTVLTNGTLFDPRRLEALRALSDDSPYSLEIRVSLDGWRAEEHDAIRGQGSFTRTLRGLEAAHDAGLLPIVTATLPAGADGNALLDRYRGLLRSVGIPRPRLKLLPMFQHGREAERTRPYDPSETLVGLSSEAFDPNRLPCARCRAVTSRGVYVCPLLVEEPGARMGDRLSDALGPFALRHGPCSTCHWTGMTCANA